MLKLRLFAAPGAVLFVALGIAACRPEAGADPRTAERVVQLFTVQPVERGASTFTGVVAARVQSNLGFRVPGKILERLVDTGQIVKAGQPLMRIDSVDLDLEITAREKAVASARAVMIQAAADEKRYAVLRKEGWSTQQKYEQVKAAFDTANAQLAAAEAMAQVSRNASDYALLVADSDGTIVETLAEPGQVVAQGQTVIRLVHNGPREASVDLPETVRPELGSEAKVTLYGGATRVSAYLRQLSDAGDPHTRTYEARYVLKGEQTLPPLGATVTVSIVAPEASAALRVPIGAIDDRGKGPGIWLVDDAASTVSYRPVKVEQIGSETATLAGGVRPGDRIVSLGGYLLREGDRVRTAGTKAAMQ
jgi:RND family efflux transporter MFP subunit